jgi:hypothetical protein
VDGCDHRHTLSSAHIEEAARVPLQFAFETLGWMEVVSLIRRDNERSIALAIRLGEQFERMVDVRGVPLCGVPAQ